MKYEESVANINVVGKQSVILELRPEFTPFLNAFCNVILDNDDEALGRTYDVLMVLDGQCCEGDYIVTTDEDEEHDLDALVKTIADHQWDDTPDRKLLASILKHFRKLLYKKRVTWG